MTVQQAIQPGKYRLRVEDYIRLDKSGAFAGHKTELIDGDVIVMSPEWRPHLRIKSEFSYRLRRAVEMAGLPHFVGIEGSIELSDRDMPQPDILLTGAIDGDGPVPRDSVPLVIEVSSTTLADDLDVKARRYAAGGIPEYWVVDVNGRVVHQMWMPEGDDYGNRRRIGFGEPIVAETIPAIIVGTTDL